MATFSKAIRTDDGSGLNIRTATITEAAETRHIQTNAVVDADDGVGLDVVGESTFEKGLHIYGHDGTVPRSVTTDTSGDLQVDVLTLPALVAGTANIGDVDVLTLPALVAGTANIGDVDVLTLPALVAGTANIGDVDVASFAAGAITEVQGDVAHGATNAGNPVQVGHEAIAHGTNPTAVAAGQATKTYANRAGIPFVLGGHPNVITRRDNFTAVQTDTALVTIATGLKIAVTRISVMADKANSVDVAARIGFGAVNTPTGVGVVLSHPGIAAGSGVVEGVGAGILGIGADGEDLRITSEVPTGGSIDVVTSYFTIES